jgi:hypothetical protein
MVHRFPLQKRESANRFARWWSRVVLVRVSGRFKCSFPMPGATVQSVFGIAGTITRLAGLSAFLELTVAWRRVSASRVS